MSFLSLNQHHKINHVDIGEGIAEVEVLKWFIQPGSVIHQFDKVCEVQSDKATVEISSRYDGIVKSINYKAGDMVPVGSSLIEIELQNQPSDGSESKSTPSATIATDDNKNDESKQSKNSSVKFLATPAVRALIKEHNVDITKVFGSGKDGRVTKEDILKYLSKMGGQSSGMKPLKSTKVEVAELQPVRKQEIAPPQSKSVAPKVDLTTQKTSASVVPKKYAGEDQTMKITGIKRQMVKSMTAALKIPHFNLMEEISMDNLVKARQNILSDVEKKYGVGKISYLPFMIKASSLALKEYPEINAYVNEDCTEITLKKSHNISIAMDTPRGLLVPVIKDVQSMSIIDIAMEIKRLQAVGQEGKLSEADLSGGTYTLSNIGSIGGTYASPVIPPPQVAIAAIGRMQEVPRFDKNKNVYAAKIVNVSYSADHRVVDGATMTRFSNRFKELIEDPIKMILELS